MTKKYIKSVRIRGKIKKVSSHFECRIRCGGRDTFSNWLFPKNPKYTKQVIYHERGNKNIERKKENIESVNITGPKQSEHSDFFVCEWSVCNSILTRFDTQIFVGNVVTLFIGVSSFGNNF